MLVLLIAVALPSRFFERLPAQAPFKKVKSIVEFLSLEYDPSAFSLVSGLWSSRVALPLLFSGSPNFYAILIQTLLDCSVPRSSL
jgi:hypothetical protein